MPIDQSKLPEHLRDDAPFAICSGCLRHSWARGEWGNRCGMTQPSGERCAGTLQPPAQDKAGEGRTPREIWIGRKRKDDYTHPLAGWIVMVDKSYAPSDWELRRLVELEPLPSAPEAPMQRIIRHLVGEAHVAEVPIAVLMRQSTAAAIGRVFSLDGDGFAIAAEGYDCVVPWGEVTSVRLVGSGRPDLLRAASTTPEAEGASSSGDREREALTDEPVFPRRVVVCGSSLLAARVREIARSIAATGCEVISPGYTGEQPTREQMEDHLGAIDDADEVVVVVGGDLEIGEHVGDEIDYAIRRGTPVRLALTNRRFDYVPPSPSPTGGEAEGAREAARALIEQRVPDLAGWRGFEEDRRVVAAIDVIAELLPADSGTRAAAARFEREQIVRWLGGEEAGALADREVEAGQPGWATAQALAAAVADLRLAGGIKHADETITVVFSPASRALRRIASGSIPSGEDGIDFHVGPAIAAYARAGLEQSSPAPEAREGDGRGRSVVELTEALARIPLGFEAGRAADRGLDGAGSAFAWLADLVGRLTHAMPIAAELDWLDEATIAAVEAAGLPTGARSLRLARELLDALISLPPSSPVEPETGDGTARPDGDGGSK